jgi:transposase
MKNDTKNDEMILVSKLEYDGLKQQVAWLIEQLKLSKHKQFGASSEKSAYDGQLNLFNEAEATADLSVLEPELTEIKTHARKKKRSAKDRLPPDLPVEVIIHELPAEECSCPECGGGLHVMGRNIREELKLIPASAVIVQHVQNVYCCRECEKNSDDGNPTTFVKATMPEPVIKGSFASPEAIAHIMTQKFVMGSPLYRQEQDWNRRGIMLSRQTMSNWLIKTTFDWLKPIYELLRQELIVHNVLHADETTLQVLREADKPAQSKSYMWLYRTSGDVVNPIVLYEYQPSRAAKHPEKFLKDFKGYLHTDGYEGYHNLPDDIIVVGCWAHVRRKFDEALKSLIEKNRKNSQSFVGKRFCDKLFEIERDIINLKADDKFNARQEQSKPILDEFWAWCKSLNSVPKTLLGTAVNYALGQQKYLNHFLLDGRLELSNNRAERSIKPFVIDRKNFLFCNTPGGAEASAIMFSLIETAKESGLDPYLYLTHIFRNAPNGFPMAELLPCNVPQACLAGRLF